jgi:hypothetical protein
LVRADFERLTSSSGPVTQFKNVTLRGIIEQNKM